MRPGSIAAIMFGIVLGTAGAAGADPYHLTAAASCIPIGMVDCLRVTCPAPGTCGQIGTPGHSGCHHGITSALCCDTSSDCQVEVAGTGILRGTCVPAMGIMATSGGRVFGVCEFFGGTRYCVPTRPLPTRAVTQCLSAGGLDWGQGDCDGDGTLNRSDSMPCGSVRFDAGPPTRADAGLVADAAVIDVDGGGADVDGGDVSLDAGELTDAAAGRDGSATSTDAGTPLPTAPGLWFAGSGGCTCRAVHGNHGPGWWLLALVALAVWRRRR